MKKVLNILLVIFAVFCMTGCNRYFKIQVEDGYDTVYYGLLDRRDMVKADVIAHKKGDNVYCDGIAFLDAPKKAKKAQVRLACSDGKLVNLEWDLRNEKFSAGSAFGIDQYGVPYQLYPIDKREYDENSPVAEPVIPNIRKNSLMNY